MTTLWDTTGTDVVKALAESRRAAGFVASGVALTLVVVANEKHVSAAEEAASIAAAAHPCRLLIVVRRQIEAPMPRLDAEISVGGRLGPGEAVVMRMYGRLAAHAESVTLPLLAPDVPVVTWWHGEPPERIAYDPLGVFADRRVTDAREAADPIAALHGRAEDYAPGDTDLGWSRTTPWRTLLAGAFDTVIGRPTSVKVITAPRNVTGTLLVGWLRSRLGLEVDLQETAKRGIAEVTVEIDDGTTISVVRQDSHHAILRRTGVPDRIQPLARRSLGEQLAEEIKRLDPDQPYGEALGAATGLTGLNQRSPFRTHVWKDPMPTATPATTS
ncbi:glucose-6-phosphate dehydrogenase assembly protein OpcA [Cryptosporangium aurantiacum]|uniref:Glucose-6-phosphate dehydrogenase assembly protein OpcA n=1 Tax=Cryptosporangium aurantiacum TaxID=134849 RepID=A0A1M7J5K1_9ACTN|nr:glucose-6-phosphate dehydrogenase assembly protein OpcA [Cryptosporangium aurantiacum]SHM48212.1 glucose-6-phosphate dehydrogenase assembly protein OpcA [Cryptosporangium aurantiacum]